MESLPGPSSTDPSEALQLRPLLEAHTQGHIGSKLKTLDQHPPGNRENSARWLEEDKVGT